jgi:hypothetical protein
MTSCIRDTPGTVGYIDAGHGHAEGLIEIELRNADGNFLSSLEASAKGGIGAAAANANLPTSADQDFGTVELLNQPGQSTWPIVAMSYIYVRKDLSFIESDDDKALLLAFLKSIYDPQYIDMCKDFGFTPVPNAVRQLGLDGIAMLDMAATPRFTFEDNTQPNFGQGDYVISSKRKTFAQIERSDVSADIEAIMEDNQMLREQVAVLQQLLTNLEVTVTKLEIIVTNNYNVDDESPVYCFSGDCEVEVENKGSVKMTDLAIGDSVKVAANKYEPIYSFAHKNDEASAEFLQIVTGGNRKPLEISKYHMVNVEGGRSVPASMVKIGDMLVTASGDLVDVRTIRNVVRKGIYAPFTESGSIIVNDIAVSNYIAYQDSEYLKLAGIETPFTYQWLAHTFNSVHRLAVMMGFTEETYSKTGISHWVALPHKVGSWLLGQNVVVALAILVPCIVFFCFVSITEALVKTHYCLATLLVGAVTLWFAAHRSVSVKMTKKM